jgi:peroxiredoxin (alkyl hydroperoxide reductase subunit C)
MPETPPENQKADDSPARTLMLGRPVPQFTARSTQGEVSLDEYRGQWLILFAHPADFTPVCTSEFIALEAARGEFQQRNCALLGLSVDSIYSHVAWVRNIREKFGVDISFPIVEDISMSISRAYGMLDSASETTATVRCVFFIDPEGILRAKVFYPMQIGRSISEILRALIALQTAETRPGMSTPEGWQPDDPLIPMAPTTLAEADLTDSQSDSPEWYYPIPLTVN